MSNIVDLQLYFTPSEKSLHMKLNITFKVLMSFLFNLLCSSRQVCVREGYSGESEQHQAHVYQDGLPVQ